MALSLAFALPFDVPHSCGVTGWQAPCRSQRVVRSEATSAHSYTQHRCATLAGSIGTSALVISVWRPRRRGGRLATSVKALEGDLELPNADLDEDLKYQVGQRVECRDAGDEEWKKGVVVSVGPLEILVDYY